MNNQKKTKRLAFCRIGFCIFVALVFLTVSVHTAAREPSLFTGNPGLFNHYGDDNGLFSPSQLSRWSRESNFSKLVQSSDRPMWIGSKFVGEIFYGIIGNLFGSFVGSVGGPYGLLTGSIVGSALGVYIYGSTKNLKGSLGSALLGSFLGEAAAFGIFLMLFDKEVEEPWGILASAAIIALPAIGAALLYNRSSSRRNKSLSVSHALLNFNRGKIRIGIPYVHIQPLHSYAKNVKPTVRFNVNLLSIVF